MTLRYFKNLHINYLLINGAAVGKLYKADELPSEPLQQTLERENFFHKPIKGLGDVIARRDVVNEAKIEK